MFFCAVFATKCLDRSEKSLFWPKLRFLGRDSGLMAMTRSMSHQDSQRQAKTLNSIEEP